MIMLRKKHAIRFLLAFKRVSELVAHFAIYGFVNQLWKAWFMKDKQFNHFVFFYLAVESVACQIWLAYLLKSFSVKI